MPPERSRSPKYTVSFRRRSFTAPAPISQPHAAAANPATRKRDVARHQLGSPSSPRRSLSNIQVENVVNDPSAAVPPSSSADPSTPRPVSRPSASEPLTLTTNVPSGNSPSKRARNGAVEREASDRAEHRRARRHRSRRARSSQPRPPRQRRREVDGREAGRDARERVGDGRPTFPSRRACRGARPGTSRTSSARRTGRCRAAAAGTSRAAAAPEARREVAEQERAADVGAERRPGPVPGPAGAARSSSARASAPTMPPTKIAPSSRARVQRPQLPCDGEHRFRFRKGHCRQPLRRASHEPGAAG